MAKVVFTFENVEIIIQCNTKDKMKDIFMKFSLKTQKDLNNLYFIYNGNIIKDDMEYGQVLNEEDKKRNTMNIIAYENNSLNESMIKSNEVICPECKESILIDIKDYQINLNKCKNGHQISNILLKDFEKTQYIDKSKINTNNKCLKHKIIFDAYCNDCNLNLCLKCFMEHRDHNAIYLGELLKNNEANINELKKNIEKFNNYIKIIIEQLNNVMKNMEIYYNISNNIISNSENLDYFNYQIIKNIEQFKIHNNIIIKDIKEIINDDAVNKFSLLQACKSINYYV